MQDVNIEAKNFGRRIAELRKSRHGSLREFCLASGYDPTQVNKWELGITLPPPDRVTHLAESLGLGEGTDPYDDFLALANSARENYIPVPLQENELFQKLPSAFRALKVDEDPDEILERARKVADDSFNPHVQ